MALCLEQEKNAVAPKILFVMQEETSISSSCGIASICLGGNSRGGCGGREQQIFNRFVRFDLRFPLFKKKNSFCPCVGWVMSSVRRASSNTPATRASSSTSSGANRNSAVGSKWSAGNLSGSAKR